MELGGTGEGVGQEEEGRVAMGCDGRGHFPRGQELAIFQCDVPHCQPLFGCAETGTKGCGMTLVLRSRGGGLTVCRELTTPLVSL